MNIEKINIEEFDMVYEIMSNAFPVEEFREYERQKSMLNNPLYSIYVCKEDGKILGFITLWQLDGVCYCEHLAVTELARNKGIGKYIFDWCFENISGMYVLEVEVPDDDMKQRRIGFYNRLGFYLNDYEYMQPAMRKNTLPIPLLIMSYPKTLSKKEFDDVKTNIYRHVHGIS